MPSKYYNILAAELRRLKKYMQASRLSSASPSYEHDYKEAQWRVHNDHLRNCELTQKYVRNSGTALNNARAALPKTVYNRQRNSKRVADSLRHPEWSQPTSHKVWRVKSTMRKEAPVFVSQVVNPNMLQLNDTSPDKHECTGVSSNVHLLLPPAPVDSARSIWQNGTTELFRSSVLSPTPPVSSTRSSPHTHVVLPPIDDGGQQGIDGYVMLPLVESDLWGGATWEAIDNLATQVQQYDLKHGFLHARVDKYYNQFLYLWDCCAKYKSATDQLDEIRLMLNKLTDLVTTLDNAQIATAMENLERIGENMSAQEVLGPTPALCEPVPEAHCKGSSSDTPILAMTLCAAAEEYSAKDLISACGYERVPRHILTYSDLQDIMFQERRVRHPTYTVREWMNELLDPDVSAIRKRQDPNESHDNDDT